jgi:hypothetical protein
MSPKRIQRQRTKGWLMPEGAVYVGRPSTWGNPFRIGQRDSMGHPRTVTSAVESYRHHLEQFLEGHPWRDVENWLTPLRGRDLVCWCPLDQPCHADVLLELANA